MNKKKEKAKKMGFSISKEFFKSLLRAWCAIWMFVCFFIPPSCYAIKSIIFWPDNGATPSLKVVSLMVDGHGMKIDEVLTTDKRFPTPGHAGTLNSWEEFVEWKSKIDFTPAKLMEYQKVMVSKWSHDPDCHRCKRTLNEDLPPVGVSWLAEYWEQKQWRTFTLPQSKSNTEFVVAISEYPEVYVLGSPERKPQIKRLVMPLKSVIMYQ